MNGNEWLSRWAVTVDFHIVTCETELFHSGYVLALTTNFYSIILELF